MGLKYNPFTNTLDFTGSGSSLPDQTGNNGKFLTTDGAIASWAALAGGGDMAAAVYDPQNIADDAFDRANHTGSQTLSTISDVTATASEVNVLDGITSTTTELNYTDGVTSNIQTQIDNKVSQGELMLNAKDYGAVGDGSTDDTAAIQSALDALTTGGWLHVPIGNYIINGTLNVPSNVRITGAGMDNGGTATSTTFKRGTVASAPMFRFNGTTPSSGSGVSPLAKKRIVMSDFTIRGNGTSDDLIEAYYTNRNHFARIRFISTTGHAVHGVEFWDSVFDSCQFDLTGDATHASILLQNNASATIGVSGYSNDNINRITFRSCTWEAFTSQCIELDATSNSSTHLINNITIDDCKFETSTFQNPYISTTNRVASVYILNSYFAANDKDAGYVGGAVDMITGSGSSLMISNCRFYQGVTDLVTSAVHLTDHSGQNMVNGATCNWSGFAPTSGAAVWIETPATPSEDSVSNVRVDTGKKLLDTTFASSFKSHQNLVAEADQTPNFVWEQTGTNAKKITLGITASGNFSMQPNNNALWTIKKPDTSNFVAFNMSTGRVGIGNVSPAVILDVTGEARVSTAGTDATSVVTVGGTQTLTNKSLTSPTVTGTPTFPTTFNSGGNSVTFPGASTTIVGRSTTDTLTNKDLTSGTNTFPTFNQSTTGSAATLTTSRTIGTLTGDIVSAGSSFNGSANNTNATTLATVNSNVGSFGSATQVATFTVNAKGLTTAAGNTSIQIAESQVTNLVSDLAAKQGTITLTTTGTSGAATLIANTLNIPQYSGGGGGGTVDSVVAGTNIDVDSTDPANPIVSLETLTLSDISDITSTAAELNILDGVTATASELNTLDGITASVTELNYTDGVTSAIQTQLDGKQPLDADLTALAAAGNSTVLAATTASFLTADETKLDGIEAAADVTDAANVSSSGGLIYVNHGSTAGTSRPSVSGAVCWIGSVEPTNATNGDVWIDT